MKILDLDQFAGHTLGPWHTCDDGNCGCGHILTSDSILTAFTAGTLNSRNNQRLIAAAPNLLAEVKRLRDVVSDQNFEIVILKDRVNILESVISGKKTCRTCKAFESECIGEYGCSDSNCKTRCVCHECVNSSEWELKI